MNSVINYDGIENRIVTATYRNLMIGAKVVLVDKASDQQLPDPITTIASPVPTGSLRIRLPATVKPGDYYLKALNGHGASIAQSVDFYVN
ncbi:MAG: uncharacterized protein JWR80_8086 [Bradyrhizobium sp.]|nr:uncharacterized protein [Bradyrhizobium sp.]